MQNTIPIISTNIEGSFLLEFKGQQNWFGYNLNSSIPRPECVLVSDSEYSNSLFVRVKDLQLNELTIGDIYFISRSNLRLVYKEGSHENVLFLTNQCNNHCLMCSQPPSEKDDIPFFFHFNKTLIGILPNHIQNIGITGGEPTLYGDKLLEIIEVLVNKNPDIKIHILTNGRYFNNFEKTQLFQKYSGQLTWGIPIHSDFYGIHDEITDNDSSYFDTLQGIYNLGRIGSSIELRIVINRINFSRLFELSEFIYKNMPFVRHVAFMGMEYFGLAVKNHQRLLIDPIDYADDLERAVINLATWKMNVSIYNIPFCLLRPSLYEFSRKSISSWKIVYSQECSFCSMRQVCGGMFGTSKFQSENIKAIKYEA
ncbi:His-Xaa-Ser system radical SAM maturase HxsC [Draconibacterium mangrovi]|uniref:His-Xaa-Ser system radical SAM maturase HxsC n=1 Tax=Draconibacterium mangrovi TaxID=2697469 RepID=UPI0013D13886|nr:His-Xaa-Ser system radical SAM maturase HxsC [Draconibacterium mangrovi]